jgi:hypothetical protein
LQLLREEVAKRASSADAYRSSKCDTDDYKVAAPLSSSPGRRRKAPSFTPSQPNDGDRDELFSFSAVPFGDRQDIRASLRSNSEIMREDEAEWRKDDGIIDLAIVNSEVTRVLRRWLFDKAQEELQLLVTSRGPAPLEAFLNVAGLLRLDADFDALVFVVLQQGLRYSQATCATSSSGYGILLREMGSCLSRQGRHQEALSHFHAARRFYESSDATNSKEYVELLHSISENACASGSHQDKRQPVTNLVTFKQVPLSASSMQARLLDSPGIMCEDPLQDIRAAFVCVPSCICNTSNNDLSQIIDLSREDTREIPPGISINSPSLAFPKEDVDELPTNDIMDFETLMHERSQIAATRQKANRLNRGRQEPMEPADAGFLDMFLLWTSKMGLTHGHCSGAQSSGCESAARPFGIPSILSGCSHRTVSIEEEWI